MFFPKYQLYNCTQDKKKVIKGDTTFFLSFVYPITIHPSNFCLLQFIISGVRGGGAGVICSIHHGSNCSSNSPMTCTALCLKSPCSTMVDGHIFEK